MSETNFERQTESNNINLSSKHVMPELNEPSDMCLVWCDIMEEYTKEREELENYIKKRDGTGQKVTLEQHPVIASLNESVFPTVCRGLILLLEKVRDETSCYRPKSAFNGIDFLSEYLYNMNQRYPERRQSWTYIFDMAWVQDHLKQSSRPYYPVSLIWSREYAALKIQSYMRGYWARRKGPVQEVRTFWKDYQLSKKTDAIK